MTQRLVLVGGGHAHLAVLRALSKKRPAGLDVALITPSRYQYYSGMLPGWVSGHYTQAQCRIDLSALTQSAGVRLVLDQVVAIDATAHDVALGDGSRIGYDLLSLDIGSETDTAALEPLAGTLLPVKPLDNFFAQWPGRLTAAQAKPGFQIVVVGGGAAGVELALAIQTAFARAGVQGRVDLVASAAGLLPGHAKTVRTRVLRFTERAGLAVHRARGLGTEQGLQLVDDGLAPARVVPADLVIAATGARPARWLAQSQLALDTRGYIAVDRYHRSMSHPNVFAAGDVCARQDTVMPRSGVHAVHAGPVLAENLLATLRGGTLRTYRSRQQSLYILACGPRYAIASWGHWSAEGQWVWHWKDWIDRGFVRKFSHNQS